MPTVAPSSAAPGKNAIGAYKLLIDCQLEDGDAEFSQPRVIDVVL